MKNEIAMTILFTSVIVTLIAWCGVEAGVFISLTILTMPIWTAIAFCIYGAYVSWEKNIKSQKIKDNVCGSYEVRCKYANKNGGCLYGKCMTDHKGVETPKSYNSKIYYIFDWLHKKNKGE